MTVSEIAKLLKIPVKTVQRRIERQNIKPITREAIYDPGIVDIIKDTVRGRPKKEP